MKVALFVPCYVDAFFPEVGIATLELLERFGCDVDYPLDQTCCGQPMANSGCQDDARATEALFAKNFAGYDYIVTPSGSCCHQVREHMTAIEQTPQVQAVRRNTYELVEFLHDVLQVRDFPWAEFPHKVGLHIGCSTLRGLREAKTSEIAEAPFNKPRELLVAGARASSSSRRSGPTSAAASAAPSRCSRSRCRPGWGRTRSTTTAARAPSTSSRRTCRASCTSRAAPKRLGLPLKFIHIAQVLNGARE